MLTRVGRTESPLAWALPPASSFRIPQSPTGGPSGPTMRVERGGREQGSEVKGRGGQDPDRRHPVGWGKAAGPKSGAGNEAGAHVDCGSSSAAPHAGRRPGRRRAAGSPGHSAPAPGSCAAGTAPCRWRDRAPRREGRPLALPDTHSAQHQGSTAARRPRLSPNQPGPSCSLPAPSCPLTLPLIHRLICPLYSNTPWLAGPLGTRFTHLWKAEGRTSGSAGTVAIVPLGQNGKGSRGHRCLLPGPSLGGREGRQKRSEAHSPCLWLPSPHPLPCSSPGAPSPLTIRDPRLWGQGTPLLALAQLYQVLKAQHGAYAGSIPRVELEEE